MYCPLPFPRACVLAAFLLASASLSAASPRPAQPGSARPPAEPTLSERPTYGPILAKAPAVRAEIKRLYLELAQLEQEAYAKLEELNARLREETDPDFRYSLQQDVGEVKKNLELRSIEIGLQIARLNEDAQRIQDFEIALDQLLHPEKYRSEHVSDATLEQQHVRRQAGE